MILAWLPPPPSLYDKINVDNEAALKEQTALGPGSGPGLTTSHFPAGFNVYFAG